MSETIARAIVAALDALRPKMFRRRSACWCGRGFPGGAKVYRRHRVGCLKAQALMAQALEALS